jgi:EF-hand domain-containing protein 1
LANLI